MSEAQNDTSTTDEKKLRALEWLLPRVGSRWTWEPDKPHARQEITVAEVKWNGEEWWVLCDGEGGRWRYWNDLGRFIEACVFVAPAETEDDEVGYTHGAMPTPGMRLRGSDA